MTDKSKIISNSVKSILKESVSTTNHRLDGRPAEKTNPREVRGSVSTTNHLLKPPVDRKK